MRNEESIMSMADRIFVDMCKDITFDRIVMDIMMPLRNGYEVLKEIRQTGNKTPVLFLTAKDALEDWYTKTEDAQWNNFADIRNTFNSVDSVGNQHYVFNIKGNDFRLVVVIKFTPQLVFIRFVGTHAEYNKITDISNL